MVFSHPLRSESGFSVSEAAGRGDRKAVRAEQKVREAHSHSGRRPRPPRPRRREKTYSPSAGGQRKCFLCLRRAAAEVAEAAEVVCLNENVLLAPFAQLGRLFCLLEPRPAVSSLGDRKAVLASQKVREYYTLSDDGFLYFVVFDGE